MIPCEVQQKDSFLHPDPQPVSSSDSTPQAGCEEPSLIENTDAQGSVSTAEEAAQESDGAKESKLSRDFGRITIGSNEGSPSTLASETTEQHATEMGSSHGECSGSDPVEVIARGRASVLRHVIEDSEARFEAAMASQDTLGVSIDRLTRVLDKLLEDTPMPFLAQHSARVSGIRKRVLSLSSTLQIIRVRMKNIESALLHQSPRRRNPQARTMSMDLSPPNQSRLVRSSTANLVPESSESRNHVIACKLPIDLNVRGDGSESSSVAHEIVEKMD